MISSATLDIIICTFNREQELLDCIASLQVQDRAQDDWRIIVINNASKPFSKEVAAHLQSVANASYFHESESGLSHARNKGIEKSRARWLGFLDDDARVPSDYISLAFELIEENQFDCFGGHIRSWWKYGKPRWLEKDFGSKPILSKGRGEIRDGFNWGSNIFIKREALTAVGNFPTNIGMKGNHIGYSAENLVQVKLRAQNYKIGYDPSMYIDHIVMPDKLKLWWHIKAAYATGRDGRKVFPDQYTFKGLLISFKNCFSRPLKALWKWITTEGFYWENVMLESGKIWGLWWGKVISTSSTTKFRRAQ